MCSRVTLWVFAAVGVMAVLVVAVAVIWKVPPALYGYVPDPKDRADTEATTRT
jgi:hypothetical protein